MQYPQHRLLLNLHLLTDERNLPTMKRIIAIIVSIVCVCALLDGCFVWTFNRTYIPEGRSLQLRYKGPLLFGSRQTAQIGHWADEGEIGVRQLMRGPGRHFYCPIWWERNVVDDVVIQPKEVGIVTCKLGDSLPAGAFLVEGELGQTKQKGILRKVLGPGRYRINPYGYEVKIVQTEKLASDGSEKCSGWVDIPTGYVGVVTNLADNPLTKQQTGIQENVLPPGIYPMNPKEQHVDIISVGYMETSVAVEKVKNAEGTEQVDEAGEPVVGKGGITFPSNDGFPITMDFTAIWGLLPNQAPHAVKTFGNLKQVENKIVLPQIESICRNFGSKYSAVDLLVGEERERFQTDAVNAFHTILDGKNVSLLYGLVRHTYIPSEVRKPIQQAFIADELKITREQEQLTAKSEASYMEAKQQVELATKKVEADTERQYAAAVAGGDREAKRIAAETKRLMAAIEKQTALLKAQATTIMGEAENKGKALVEQAKADKFRLAVEAFGTANAYNNWVFANGVPEEVDLKLFYSGQGTLWTDVKSLNPTLLVDPSKAEKKVVPPAPVVVPPLPTVEPAKQ